MQLIVDQRGGVHCLYGETITLAALGDLAIRRASLVEPEGAEWFADLSLVQGPKLGPFSLRSEALRAEVEWLERRLAEAHVV
jgi:hypothetical protein